MIKNEEIILLHNNQITDFSISEDENKIAYVYGNLDIPHSFYLNDIKKREIRIFDNENRSACRTFFKEFDQHSPSFSHDGSKLAFLSLIHSKVQLNVYDFQKESIILTTDLQYTGPNAFYDVLSKDIYWSIDDRYIVTYYYEKGIDYYKVPNDFTQSMLVIDMKNMSSKEHLKSNIPYKIHGFFEPLGVAFQKGKHLWIYNIETFETSPLNVFNHEVIRFVKRDVMFADVDINKIYFGRNDQVIAESLIDGEQIKAIDIAYDGHYAIFVVYKKMSVFLVKLMKTGDVLYLSKENEVVYHKDSHAGPKCTKKGVFFVKSSSEIHHEFFMLENEEINQVSNFNTSIVGNIQVDIKVDEFESGGSIIETPILLPKNYNKKEKYPLLIYIHGGPNSFESITIQNLMSARGLSCAIQLCQEGFIIALPNYRGTRGYGDKHKQSVPRFSMEFSDSVYEDIRNCKKMLQEKYSVDVEKVGLYGTSYGAQITGWIIANCNEYQAACGIVGVRYDEEHYSILSLTEHFNCPFQIIETGMAEGRFHVGKNLYNKLLLSNKKTEYYIYSQAFHNGGWIDEYKLDYMKRLINFFNKYLK